MVGKMLLQIIIAFVYVCVCVSAYKLLCPQGCALIYLFIKCVLLRIFTYFYLFIFTSCLRRRELIRFGVSAAYTRVNSTL